MELYRDTATSIVTNLYHIVEDRGVSWDRAGDLFLEHVKTAHDADLHATAPAAPKSVDANPTASPEGNQLGDPPREYG